MVNRPKAIGTAAETLVTRWLRINGYPHAERRALAGNADQGDILATRGLVLEVKAGQQTRKPGDADLDAWCRQADAEALNAGELRVPVTARTSWLTGTVCLLVLQRHGTRDVSRWWTVTRGHHQGYVWRELGDVLPSLAEHIRPSATPEPLRSADQST